jgi:hypothetical protein
VNTAGQALQIGRVLGGYQGCVECEGCGVGAGCACCGRAGYARLARRWHPALLP